MHRTRSERMPRYQRAVDGELRSGGRRTTDAPNHPGLLGKAHRGVTKPPIDRIADCEVSDARPAHVAASVAACPSRVSHRDDAPPFRLPGRCPRPPSLAARDAVERLRRGDLRSIGGWFFVSVHSSETAKCEIRPLDVQLRPLRACERHDCRPRCPREAPQAPFLHLGAFCSAGPSGCCEYFRGHFTPLEGDVFFRGREH